MDQADLLSAVFVKIDNHMASSVELDLFEDPALMLSVE
jgi:hypothetical protein